MTSSPFRFGVVATPHPDGTGWLDTARKAVRQGYATLVMPDGLQLLAPGPSLAAAATAAPGLRVGTWVYAAPLRPAPAVAWEAHSLAVLTDGRFEFGIGAGRPDARGFADRLALPFGSPGERLEQVRASVTALRELDGPDRHTPVLVAAGGPRARALAGEVADIVSLAVSPLTPRAEVADMVADVRDHAGGRDIEFAMGVFAVGSDLPSYLRDQIGADPATLVDQRSLVLLPEDPAAMADELRARREELGISYWTINAAYADALAPAIAALVVGAPS
jgi:alkanesulfonate monooxygenase SsuD/methylene tetrahydromethanopterin reductase-like flavin-dependent oxidoreductase (luciferase family)